jgi:hypothetical protein
MNGAVSGIALRRLGLVAAGLYMRLATLPRAPDVDDSFLFVNGVIRFSIQETRPHWPGYPVYIWAGKALAALVGDPVLALHLVSAFSSALVAWPLAAVACAWTMSLGGTETVSERAGLSAAALWIVSPMAWVTASQIVSDAFGMLLGVLMLALAAVGERHVRRCARAWTLAAIVAGVMTGVRLVNVMMMGPLLWKAWRARGERWWGCPAPLLIGSAFLAGVVPWAVWLISRGGVDYAHGAEYHLQGHFTRWGNSVFTDPHPLLRPFAALRTLVLYGLGAGWPAQGWARPAVGVAWAVLLALAVKQRWRSPIADLVALWGIPQLVYLFLGHDVTLPRYMLPAVALSALLGGIAAARAPRIGAATLTMAVVSMVVVSHHLALSRRAGPLVEYAAAKYLETQPRAALAVVDVPSLGFYLQFSPSVVWANTRYPQIETKRARWTAAGLRVFATAPPPDSTGWRPVAHFCLDPLVDPRPPHELWLFAPGPTVSDRPLGCGEAY